MQKLESPLHLSRHFIVFHSLMLFGSLAIVYYLEIKLGIKIILSVGLLIYSGFILYQHAQWQAIWHDESGWGIFRAGKASQIEITGDSTVTTYVVILRFRLAEKRRKQSCVIFSDAMKDDTYRQMVIRLRNG